ncbi:hypothetical protein ASD00_36280 [Ensifer sp. Root31]|uniref:hypothetical protein n=1 Tax=Ensifer sp. Root31 TaxID=1736512 RepID=UPI00071052F5|nr:hypothetical protein [Ensifer sp. Root31]KQU79317.1 hypothetical protein ASD00_36280 [Ensifer sp. Root31]
MRQEHGTMELPKRAQRLEWNLNTIIQLVTLVCMFAGGVAIWVEKSRDIEELQNWHAGHELLHKERLVEVKAVEARNEERFRSLEADVRKIENLTYRVTIMEQFSGSTTTAIKDLQSLVSQQSGGLKVMREILQLEYPF